MEPREHGRVVVVTGANEGIGHHVVRALLADGYRVAGLDVDTDQLESVRADHADQLLVAECDVTDDAAVQQTIDDVIDEWDQIDVLVNNAAVFTYAPFVEQTLEDTRREFEVNYFGYVRTIRTVLPHMLARGEGTIHNVSSGVGLVGHPGLSGYASTKGAIDALTKTLRMELADEDISCSVMYPALTNTRSAAEIGYPSSLLADPAEVGRKLASKIESTDAVITADWQTRIGLWLARRVPWLVKRGTERFVDPPERSETRVG